MSRCFIGFHEVAPELAWEAESENYRRLIDRLNAANHILEIEFEKYSSADIYLKKIKEIHKVSQLYIAKLLKLEEMTMSNYKEYEETMEFFEDFSKRHRYKWRRNH